MGMVTASGFSISVFFASAALAQTPAAARAAKAHTYWRVPAAVTGALIGAGVGYALDVAAWNGELGGLTLAFTTAGVVSGGVLGYISGNRTDRILARGDTLSTARRSWFRKVAFLAPVAVGSGLAFAIINPDDTCGPPYESCSYSQPAMSDESVLLLGVGGGLVLGFVAQHFAARSLRPQSRVSIAPAGNGLSLRVQF
jgi:hypothetical protein